MTVASIIVAMEPATTKFQLALPFILLPLSPGLAALHASRADHAHDVDISFKTPRCSSCGSSFLHGAGTIRIIRRNPSNKTQRGPALPRRARFLRYSCSSCGREEDIPVEPSNPDVLQSMPKPKLKKKDALDQRFHHASAKKAPSLHHDKKRKAGAQFDPPSAHSALRSSASGSLPMLPAAKESMALSSIQSSVIPPKFSADRAKQRQKTKPGLQSLLAKNREKQQQGTQKDNGGLSTFLQTL